MHFSIIIYKIINKKCKKNNIKIINKNLHLHKFEINTLIVDLTCNGIDYGNINYGRIEYKLNK